MRRIDTATYPIESSASERASSTWSDGIAREFIRWLSLPPGSRWIDIGCTTGDLCGAILDLSSPIEVVGVDPAPESVASAASRHPDLRVRFVTGCVTALPVESSRFDVAVSGSLLDCMPPEPVLHEMWRTVEPGGVVAAYAWDYAAGMQVARAFWDAAVELNPGASGLDEGRRHTGASPGHLRVFFEDAGLREVRTEAVEAPAEFAAFDNYWASLLEGSGPKGRYLAALSGDERAALREHLRASLPASPDGSITLAARAWAIRGTR